MGGSDLSRMSGIGSQKWTLGAKDHNHGDIVMKHLSKRISFKKGVCVARDIIDVRING